MNAAKCIGRVGGLAVALGVGTAVFVGVGAAWADEAGSPGSGESSSGGPSRSVDRHVGGSAKPGSQGRSRGESVRPAGSVTDLASGVRGESLVSRAAAVTSDSSEAVSSSSSITALASSSDAAAPFGGSIDVNPQLGWDDGILRGTVGATSSNGLPLIFSVESGPSLGGKVTFSRDHPQGEFTYLPYTTTLTNPGLNEQFSIRVSETTRFTELLAGIPIIGLVVPDLVQILHQIPIVGGLLSPLIGSSQVVKFDENPYTLIAGRPAGFTYLMPSFDGTLISVNYFPALDVSTGAASTAPLVLKGPPLGDPGTTNPDAMGETPVAPESPPLSPGVAPYRTGAMPGYSGTGGYNVITWDARGTFDSGGVLQINNPFWEGRDASAIISWAVSSGNPALSQIAMESPGDPLLGMVGGSYAGGIQLIATGTPDRRVDAIVPSLAWNSLNTSLYPSNTFKSSWATLLLGKLAAGGARLNSQIYAGILMGDLLGFLSSSSQAFLADSGPTILVNNIAVPTLFVQGTADGLFTLEQAVVNAQQIATANPQVPVKMVWFCGGHGLCQDPTGMEQWPQTLTDSLKWLDQYVAGDGTPADSIPDFQWFDQLGQQHTSSLLPYQSGFNNPEPLSYQGSGGLLGIVPVLGGSGPVPSDAVIPEITFVIGQAAAARNALNLTVATPLGTRVAGAPMVSFTYSGIGTSRAVFAQLVDNQTGRVVGNMVTPVPVTLDGRQHTVEIPMENITYTSYGLNDSLTLQITSSATMYENFTSFGLINISDIALDLPTVAG